MKKIGLIINPVAGMGGKVGLKGTDGLDIVEKAVKMGARPEAEAKALLALKALLPIKDKIELITCPGPMGEDAALKAGFKPRLLGIPAFHTVKQMDNKDTLSQEDNRVTPSREENAKTSSQEDKTVTPSQEDVTVTPSRDNNTVTSSQEENFKTPSPLRGEGRGGGEKDFCPFQSSDIRPSDLQNGEGRGGGEVNFLCSTLPTHTEAAAKALAAEPVDLLLFAGGDGTARNVHNALGEDTTLTVIGIPAGVKIHSAFYATTPQSAGELARQYLAEGGLPLRQAEVMDIDEEAFREGRLSARLYGYLPVPCSANLMQHLKVGRAASETSTLEAIAEQVVENMQGGVVYIIGPGSTIIPIMEKLGLKNTLLGVDVVRDGKLLAADVGEKELLEIIRGQETRIIVTVIGGQGYIFGRGNQQISAEVIRRVGRDNIIVVATKEKILALEQKSLLVDTGNEEVNNQLHGYIRVTTGYGEQLICKVR
jgi:predicted polyphosphate/ATP-dependent NAD kinase